MFGLLNLAGLTWAIATGEWRLRQIYDAAYFPLAGIMDLGAAISPAREAIDEARGHERRFFYGTVWAACVAQPVLLLLWKWLPHARWADAVKFGVFAGTLVVMGELARRGQLIRTRPVKPGELAVSD